MKCISVITSLKALKWIELEESEHSTFSMGKYTYG